MLTLARARARIAARARLVVQRRPGGSVADDSGAGETARAKGFEVAKKTSGSTSGGTGVRVKGVDTPFAVARLGLGCSGPTTVAPPDEWRYLDPQGKTRGPFTQAQMIGWAPHFPPSVMVFSPGAAAPVPLSSLGKLSAWVWELPDEWHYLDPSGHKRGPFTQANMIQWQAKFPPATMVFTPGAVAPLRLDHLGSLAVWRVSMPTATGIPEPVAASTLHAAPAPYAYAPVPAAMYYAPAEPTPAEPTSTPPLLAAGDSVVWSKEDDDIPRGAIGTIRGFLAEPGRVHVKFPHHGVFDLNVSELTRHAAVASALTAGDSVMWAKSDIDIPPGSVGRVKELCGNGRVHVQFGAEVFDLSASEVCIVQSTHDDAAQPGSSAHAGPLPASTLAPLVVGDSVVWSKEDGDIPRGAVGTVEQLCENGRIHVRFPESGVFDLSESELRVAPAHFGMVHAIHCSHAECAAWRREGQPYFAHWEAGKLVSEAMYTRTVFERKLGVRAGDHVVMFGSLGNPSRTHDAIAVGNDEIIEYAKTGVHQCTLQHFERRARKKWWPAIRSSKHVYVEDYGDLPTRSIRETLEVAHCRLGEKNHNPLTNNCVHFVHDAKLARSERVTSNAPVKIIKRLALVVSAIKVAGMIPKMILFYGLLPDLVPALADVISRWELSFAKSQTELAINVTVCCLKHVGLLGFQRLAMVGAAELLAMAGLDAAIGAALTAFLVAAEAAVVSAGGALLAVGGAILEGVLVPAMGFVAANALPVVLGAAALLCVGYGMYRIFGKRKRRKNRRKRNASGTSI